MNKLYSKKERIGRVCVRIGQELESLVLFFIKLSDEIMTVLITALSSNLYILLNHTECLSKGQELSFILQSLVHKK